MHKTLGQCDPASAFPLAHGRDDGDERRQANHAVAVSAIGLGATGVAELLLAVVTSSWGRWAMRSTACPTFPLAPWSLGFRLSRRPPPGQYPYGLERTEDLAGVDIAMVIWASARADTPGGMSHVADNGQRGGIRHSGAGAEQDGGSRPGVQTTAPQRLPSNRSATVLRIFR